MATETSPAPWDLASGESWSIKSADHRIANDGNNERIVDAKGEVVAYVSGNDDGSNGALLAAAPELVKVLLANRRVLLAVAQNLESSELLGDVNQVIGRTYAALKKVGAL